MSNRGRLRYAAMMLRGCHRELALLLALTAMVSVLAGLPAYFSRAIVDAAIPKRDTNLLAILVVAILMNALVYAATSYAQGLVNVRLSQRLTVALRRRLTSAIYGAPLSAFARTTIGELLTRVSNDVDALDGIWSGPLVAMCSNITLVLVTMIYVLLISPPLAALALILIPVTALVVNRLGRKIYEVRLENRRVRDRLNAVVSETFSPVGLAFVKAYGIEHREQQRIESLTDDLRESELQGAGIALSFGIFSTWSTMSTPALLWFAGFFLIQAHALSLGGLFAVIALILRIYSPATALAAMQLQLSSAAATFDRVVQYLELEREPSGGRRVPRAGGRGPSISFEGVWFRYSERASDVLRDVDLVIGGGEFAAITGPSGAGKTSLVQLLLRFYELSAGRIMVDGADLRDYDIRALRGEIAYVAQDAFFLNDTIAHNLRLVAPDATDEDIELALRRARAEFVYQLPDGLQTVAGDRGMKFSGGQRQRLAFVRALLRKPRLLILDEATNALDTETEAEVLAALGEALPEATKILITHRTTALAFADRVITMREGRIFTEPLGAVV